MPNLNKRKHRFKDKIRNVKEAEKYLRENKNKKFQQSHGKNWKYGHLTTAQALGPADKFMEKTIAKVMNVGKQTNANVTSSKRDLGKFEKDMTARFKERTKREGSDLDVSDSELSGNEVLDEIDENDDIFMFRDKRRKKGKRKTGSDDEEIDENASSYDSKEDLLESSGDDLENDNDNSVPFTQLEENNAKDIDTVMQEEEEEEDVDNDSPLDSDEEIEKTLSANKKTKAWNDENIDLSRVEKEIDKGMFGTNLKEQRMLEISKKYNQKEENASQSGNESTSTEFSDIERNIADEDGEENLGKVEWGRNQKVYYGADTQTETLKSASADTQWQELRDEEKIGLQMQKNLAKASRKEDFYDKEILSLMKEWITQEKEAERQNGTNNFEDEHDDTVDDIMPEKKQQIAKKIPKSAQKEKKSQETQFQPVNEVPTEKIVKNWTSVATEDDVMDVVRRDHPELPGIVTELKVTIQEMENVNSIRKKAISDKFANAVNDATMFLDLLRTYASILCFFLKLKSQGKMQKKNVIFSRMLQLRRRIGTLRDIYQNTINTMESLRTVFSRQNYNKEFKRKIEHIKRKMEDEKKEEEKKNEEIAKKKEKLAKMEKKLNEKEKKIIDEYVRKEERKMTNWKVEDTEADSQKDRRLINMKIFKSIGLRRYRKQAIPRIKKKMKYKKVLKLRKIKGYKPYKGQLPQGRDEYNIPIQVSHSKKLLSGRPKSF